MGSSLTALSFAFCVSRLYVSYHGMNAYVAISIPHLYTSAPVIMIFYLVCKAIVSVKDVSRTRQAYKWWVLSELLPEENICSYI